VYVSPSASGTVTSDVGGISCTSSGTGCSARFANTTDTVTLTAAPAGGYVFTGWSGNCSGTALTAKVTMNGSRSCTASFSTNTLTAYVNPAAGGTVVSDVGSISCTTYGGAGCSANIATYGQTVTLTAAPAANYTFTGWSGACSGTALTARVTMNGSQSCYANFATNTLTVYVSPASGGTITSDLGSINCTTFGGANCSATYAVNQEVTLTAAPATNYTFTGWTGACSAAGTKASVIVSMTAAKSCTAAFATNTLTVGTAAGSGTIMSSVGGIECTDGTGICQANFAYGTGLTLTATPASGYVFTGWSGTGCSGTSATTSVEMMSSVTCYASYAARQTLTVGVSGSGTVTSNVAGAGTGINCGMTCSDTYTYGTVVTLTAAPATGYVFSTWSGSCSGTALSAAVTMTAARSCTANFTLQTYQLDVAVIGRGTVVSAPNGIACGSVCSASLPAATVVVLTAVPNSGEAFTSWGGACDGFGTALQATVSMTAATSCSATFTATGTPTGYRGAFTTGAYDSTQCTNWTAYRGALSASMIYSSVTIRGTVDTTGVTCSGASANSICQALRAGTALAGVSCGGKYWDVGSCSSSVEIHASDTAGGLCSCGGSGQYTVRPCYATRGYQGSIGDSCGKGASPQAIEVECLPTNVMVAIEGNGSVSSSPPGIDCPGDCGELYADTTVVTLTATPSAGYAFQQWTGDCSGPDATTSVTASTAAAKSCTAVFAKASYTYSGNFVGSATPAQQCTDWGTFKTALSGTFTSVTLRGSLDTTGITCTGSTADAICQAIKAGTYISPTYCNGNYWSTTNCLGAFELSASTSSTSACSCTTAGNIHTVRPCISSSMWGGIGDSCSTTSQTLAVDCQ
jgi:uncharacterized repeat protein (TIGR02543 family)